MIKTPVKELGRWYSRHQTDVNVCIAKAPRKHGIGMLDKTTGFLSETLGIKIPDRKNLLHTHGKIKEAIQIVAERRKEENQTKHAAAVHHADGYQGDIEWEQNGKKCVQPAEVVEARMTMDLNVHTTTTTLGVNLHLL